MGCFLLPPSSAQAQHAVQTHRAALTAEPVAVEALPCWAPPCASNAVCSCKASSLSLSYSHSPLPPSAHCYTYFETEYLKVFCAGLELMTLLSQLPHS